MGRLINLVGKQFTRWRVIAPVECRRIPCGDWTYPWLCQCVCGVEKIVDGGHLRSGASRSCGCLHREMMTTHSMSKTRIYRVWAAMKQRCLNPNNKGYDNYGGRGIGIDDPDWHEFVSFYADVGDRAHNDLSLDRINNNAGYGSTNYRWATRSEQARNRRPRKRRKHRRADIADIQAFAAALTRAASASTQEAKP